MGDGGYNFKMCGDIVRNSIQTLFFTVAIAIVCHCISFTAVALDPIVVEYGFSDLSDYNAFEFNTLSFSSAADGDEDAASTSDGGELYDRSTLENEAFSFDTFDWSAYERTFNPSFNPKYDSPATVIPFQSIRSPALDSGGMVQDSGVPPDPTLPKPDIDTKTVNSAIVDIRNYIFFAIYGIFPLMCALLILYLLFRWIYRLVVYGI